MKKFGQCGLCLDIAIDPLCCLKGHIYCKSCIVEHLVDQKKKFRENLEKWRISTEVNKLKTEKKQIDQKMINAEAFAGLSDEMPKYKFDTKYAKYSPDEAIRIKAIEELKKDKTKAVDQTDWYKTAYWTPQNLPEGLSVAIKKPIQQLMCPTIGEKSHPIKMKKLMRLEFTKDSNGQYNDD